jgi:hypothetical protein
MFFRLNQRSRIQEDQITVIKIKTRILHKIKCPFLPAISHWLTMGKHAHRFKTKNRPSGHNKTNKVKE